MAEDCLWCLIKQVVRVWERNDKLSRVGTLQQISPIYTCKNCDNETTISRVGTSQQILPIYS